MFGSESTNQLKTANEQNAVTTKSVPSSSTIQVLIPKVEPPSTLDEENNDEELEVSIPFTAPYKIRDPTVLLERCDKIWETFKMIKDAQTTNQIDTSRNIVPPEDTNSYIQYQPSSADGGNVKSRFKFVVKNQKALFHCVSCGKQYKNNRDLRHHSYKVHSIYILPKRSWHSTKKIKETIEEDNNLTKDIRNLEELPSRNSEENPLSGTLQPVSERNITSTTNDLTNKRTQHTLSQLRKRKVNDANKSVRNEREKKTLKEKVEQQTACVLCDQGVNNIKHHLITYHKIASPDFMLKNVIEVSPNLSSEKVDLDNLNSTIGQSEERSLMSKEDATVPCTNPNKKCKREVDKKAQNKTLQTQTYKCHVCLGNYKKSSYYSHVRLHRLRGQTRENFHSFYNRYINSALYVKKRRWRKKELKLSSEFRTSVNKSIESNKDTSNLDTNEKMLNPNLENDKGEEIARKGGNKRQKYAKRSNFNEISPNAIKVAIKEENDTSTVVHENRSNNESEHVSHSGSTSENIQSKPEDHVDTLDVSFNYSENHSILKIQCVEEDIEIDIEDNSQTDFSDNTLKVRSEGGKPESTGTERTSKNIETEADRELSRKDNNSKSLKLKVRSEKLINETQERYNMRFSKRYDCSCGKHVYTKTSFDLHMNQAHTSSDLTCGYCKACFPNINTWKLHECTGHDGKEFTDLMMELTCSYCDTVHKSYKDFDHHVMNEHFNCQLPYLCFQCSERFSTEKNRKIHWSEKHKMCVLCSICKTEYKLRDKSKHKAYHCGLGIPCHICKKAYINSATYMIHKSKRKHYKGMLNRKRKISEHVSQ